MSESKSERQRRWITLGELIALAALIVSAAGVWISWKSSEKNRPTEVVERRQPIPLTLRARASNDGRMLEISPTEQSHALESLKLTFPGGTPVEIGGDGELSASDVEQALKGHDKEPKDRTLALRLRIDADYVEAGKERRASGSYTIRYRWEGGGLFGGRSLRLVSLSRG